MSGRGRATMNFLRGGGAGGKSRMYADGGTVNFGHDDRMNMNFTSNRSRTIRRVPRNFQHRLGGDDDVQMDGPDGMNRNFANRGGFRGRGQFRGGQRMRRGNRRIDNNNHSFGPGWHKVTIPNGATLDRDFVLNSIGSLTQASFQPISYTKLAVNAIFFIENRECAEAVAACSGRFSGPDAQPILLKVDTSGPPPTATLDATVEAALKAALIPRYDPAGPSLNLQNFSNSPEVVREYYVPLFRPSVVTKIFNILIEILPKLQILDISSNKLGTLESFQKLAQLTPNLKALNLSDNKLRDVFLLERIKGLPLLEIVLDKNPLVDKFANKDDYIRALRKYFPKVTKVDGIDSPAPPSFDVEEAKQLIPSILPGFSCNDEAKRVVGTFVEQYYKIYDSDNREPLFSAYHESAVLTIQSWSTRHGNEAPNTKLTAYFVEARNFLKNQDVGRLERCCHQGKLDIVAFLSKLPKTTHDVNAFVVDLTVALPTLINFSITGCFKERGGERNMSLRYFHRTFVLVPLNQGYVIVNEMMFVSNATNDQIKVAFSIPNAAPAPVPAPTAAPSTSAAASSMQHPASSMSVAELPNIPSLSITSDSDRKALMIKEFAKQSTMNEAWAEKCLDQNGWDYDKSAQVFTELHKNGSIPPEAFVK